MLFRTNLFYDKQLLRDYPSVYFVFGDNLKRYGAGGQAVIRHEPNAIGIATKRAPGISREDYFSDNSVVIDKL
jgi:hypothetical protein